MTFFASPCRPISKITVSYLQENLLKLIKGKLNINKNGILKIVRNQNVNKAQGHDNISITMLNICDSVLAEPL